MPSLLEADPELPGVTGVQPAVSYLAEAWRRVAGGRVEVGTSQAIYWLEHVNDLPLQPGGHCRPADQSDRDLLIKWMDAFSRETDTPGTNVESDVERRVRDGHIYVWEDEHLVSMVGRRSSVAGVVRLGPVYTPPEARRHGYGTALVAEVSRHALATDATKSMLYTDLANSTSNSIYQCSPSSSCDLSAVRRSRHQVFISSAVSASGSRSWESPTLLLASPMPVNPTLTRVDPSSQS